MAPRSCYFRLFLVKFDLSVTYKCALLNSYWLNIIWHAENGYLREHRLGGTPYIDCSGNHVHTHLLDGALETHTFSFHDKTWPKGLSNSRIFLGRRQRRRYGISFTSAMLSL
jgi:hypothetical protein